MPETPTIIPAGAVTTLSTNLFSVITANALAITGVIGLAVAVTFVIRWFTKSTRRMKP